MFVRSQEIYILRRIQELGMNPEQDGLKDYVIGFKFGCATHGGDGFGLERIAQFYL